MKEKKKFYEQWWFWLIFALIIVGVFIFTKLEVDNELSNIREDNKRIQNSTEERRKRWEELN